MSPSLHVSVIIPVYNGASFLREALDTVRLQSRVPRELILVDDGSTDDSVRVAKEWSNEYSLPFVFIQLATDVNSGSPARPLNLGIASATSPLISVLEQDDCFEPTKIEKCLHRFAQWPELCFVTHGGRRFEKRHRAASLAQRHFERDCRRNPNVVRSKGAWRMSAEVGLRMAITHSMYPSGFPGIMFRKSAWQKVGQLAECYKVATDFSFLVSLSTIGESCYLPERLYRRRSHGANLSQNSSLAYLEVLQFLAAMLYQHPGMLEVPGLREAFRWRTIESAWNIAAFGFHTQARRIIDRAIDAGGWTFKREIQRRVLRILPIYRATMMSTAKSNVATADAIVQSAHAVIDHCRIKHGRPRH